MLHTVKDTDMLSKGFIIISVSCFKEIFFFLNEKHETCFACQQHGSDVTSCGWL